MHTMWTDLYTKPLSHTRRHGDHVKQHGDDAPGHAATGAKELLDAGEPDGSRRAGSAPVSVEEI